MMMTFSTTKANTRAMTSALPTTALEHVTLYKNDLAFVERKAKLSDGKKTATSGQQAFKIDVPNENRALTMATVAVTAGESAGVMVDYNTASRSQAIPEKRPFGFTLGPKVGLGNFLASVVGAEVELSIEGKEQASTAGTVVMVDERTRVVPGTKDVTEKYISELQLLGTDDGSLTRVPLESILSVRLTDPALQKELQLALQAELRQRQPAPPASSSSELRVTVLQPDLPEDADLHVAYAEPTKEWLCQYR